MIIDYSSYRAYVKQDLYARDLDKVTLCQYLKNPSLRYQLRLRRCEFFYNTAKRKPWRYCLFAKRFIIIGVR